MDQIDSSILDALQNNARISNKELAAAVGLSPSACLERVRRLQREQVLRGFHAELNPQALGIGLQAFVTVRLSQHSRDVVDAFRAHITTLSEVVNVYHSAGESDFVVHVAVRDADHLRNLTLDGFTTRTEVSRLTTMLIYEHVMQHKYPNYSDERSSST